MASAIERFLFPEGNFQQIKATAPDQKTYNIEATKDLVENLPGGVLKDILAPAAAGIMSPFYDAIQAATSSAVVSYFVPPPTLGIQHPAEIQAS